MYKEPRRNPFLEKDYRSNPLENDERGYSFWSLHKYDLFDPAEYAKLGWKLPMVAFCLIFCGGFFSIAPPLITIMWYAIWILDFFILILGFVFMIAGWWECIAHGRSVIRHAVAGTAVNFVFGGFLIWLFFHFLSLM